MRTSWSAGRRRFGADTKSTLGIRINKRDVALKPKRTKHLLLHRTRVPRCARAIRPLFLPPFPRHRTGPYALPACLPCRWCPDTHLARYFFLWGRYLRLPNVRLLPEPLFEKCFDTACSAYSSFKFDPPILRKNIRD